MGAVDHETAGVASRDGGQEASLEQAIQKSLDGLLGALELEPLGDDRFRVTSEPGRFDRIFGGQTVAQALVAASATVEGKAPHSLHAYFVEAGTPEQPLLIGVERVRDGRSMATRRVTIAQGERTLLTALVSFHDSPTEPELAGPPPSVPGPDELPRLQDWVHEMPPETRERGYGWIERPPPLDMRIGEPPTFLGGGRAEGTRSHWMRVPRDVGDDPLLHAALLAYASDYLLLDVAVRAHPGLDGTDPYMGFSLDHGLWLHRPVRFDRWHLHTQESVALSGHRGLTRGSIHDEDGHLVASAVQEVLLRPAR